MEIKKPICAVNFKVYRQSTGIEAVDLSILLEKIARDMELDKNLLIIPSLLDVVTIKNKIEAEVFSQSAEYKDEGSNTGHITLENLKKWGINGIMLNHSENRIQHSEIEKIIEKAKSMDIKTLVCAKDTEEAKIFAKMSPDIIAVEPPELIGSGISVSKAKPEVITNSVKAVKEIDDKITVLCGAGISGQEDTKKAIELGAEGVLLASYITKAENKEEKIREIMTGIKG